MDEDGRLRPVGTNLPLRYVQNCTYSGAEGINEKTPWFSLYFNTLITYGALNFKLAVRTIV